jgi:hypothetical protein
VVVVVVLMQGGLRGVEETRGVDDEVGGEVFDWGVGWPVGCDAAEDYAGVVDGVAEIAGAR